MAPPFILISFRHSPFDAYSFLQQICLAIEAQPANSGFVGHNLFKMSQPPSELENNQEISGQGPLASPRTAAVTTGFEDLGIDIDGCSTNTASLYARLERNEEVDEISPPGDYATSYTEIHTNSHSQGEAQNNLYNENTSGERNIRLKPRVDTKGEAHGLPSDQDSLEPHLQAGTMGCPLEPSDDRPSSCLAASTESAQDNEKESSEGVPEPAALSNIPFSGGHTRSSDSTPTMQNPDPNPLNLNQLHTIRDASKQVDKIDREETADTRPDQGINPNTWQDFEITGHLMIDPQDDGYGMNGIGFQPSRQEAAARLRKRRQQIADWRANEAKEARDKRSLKRRKMTDWNAEEEEERYCRESKTRRTVRFAIDTA